MDSSIFHWLPLKKYRNEVEANCGWAADRYMHTGRAYVPPNVLSAGQACKNIYIFLFKLLEMI